MLNKYCPECQEVVQVDEDGFCENCGSQVNGSCDCDDCSCDCNCSEDEE